MHERSSPTISARRAAFVHPGELFVSGTPHEVSTLLGSCIAVCLYDEVLRVGGMNHFLLPSAGGRDAASPRFASGAVSALILRMLRLGCNKSHLGAKVFGGGCVLQAFRNAPDEAHLGDRNAEAARQALRAHNIPIVAENVGGKRGRKVLFRTDDGVAFVREL